MTACGLAQTPQPVGDSARPAASDAEYRRKILSLLEQNAQLKAEKHAMDEEQRLLVIAGALMMCIAGFIAFRALQGRRREARLRVEAAEAERLRNTAASAEREQEIQQMFTEQLILSQEQERARIAHDLHDGLSQGLLVIRNRALTGLRGALEVDALAAHLGAISDLAAQAVDDVRAISRDLRPSQLDRLGLSETLRAMLTTVAEASETRFTFDVADIDGLVAREHEINVFRVVQEGVNNMLKHARAREALVMVSCTDGCLRITLEDDGLGFNSTARNGRGAGFGLHGMHERVRMLGGDIDISTIPGGGGTAIHIVIPVEATTYRKAESAA